VDHWLVWNLKVKNKGEWQKWQKLMIHIVQCSLSFIFFLQFYIATKLWSVLIQYFVPFFLFIIWIIMCPKLFSTRRNRLSQNNIILLYEYYCLWYKNTYATRIFGTVCTVKNYVIVYGVIVPIPRDRYSHLTPAWDKERIFGTVCMVWEYCMI
jgi:hypothetical protein